MKRWLTWGSIVCFTAVLIFCPAAWPQQRTRFITPGDFIPEISLPMPSADSDIAYLGLPKKLPGLVKGDAFFSRR